MMVWLIKGTGTAGVMEWLLGPFLRFKSINYTSSSRM